MLVRIIWTDNASGAANQQGKYKEGVEMMKYRVHIIDERAKNNPWSGAYLGRDYTPHTEVIEAKDDQKAIQCAREIVQARDQHLAKSDTSARCLLERLDRIDQEEKTSPVPV